MIARSSRVAKLEGVKSEKSYEVEESMKLLRSSVCTAPSPFYMLVSCSVDTSTSMLATES